MNTLLSPRERTLAPITLVLGILVWLLLIIGTFGIVLVYLALIMLGYLFAQSALIAWIKGTAVKLSPTQLPALHAQFMTCCQKLQIETPPDAYLMQGEGMLNAFATRFLGRNFVVLLSDVVDAMDTQPDGINFYMGHELGHIKRKHLTGHIWRIPILWLPLLGAAYSRAKEYTCDLHGRACCNEPDSAPRALLVLAAGMQQWRHVHIGNYIAQAQENAGFWASFHELVSGYPWLNKRVAKVVDPLHIPRKHNPFAIFFALFVPFSGRGGGLVSIVITFFTLSILFSIALPAYYDNHKRQAMNKAWVLSSQARLKLSEYSQKNGGYFPETLAKININEKLADDITLKLHFEDAELEVMTAKGSMMLIPLLNEDDSINWHCETGKNISFSHLPPSCRIRN